MEFTGEIDDLVVDYSTNRQKLVLRSNMDITDIFESFKGKELDVKIEKRTCTKEEYKTFVRIKKKGLQKPSVKFWRDKNDER